LGRSQVSWGSLEAEGNWAAMDAQGSAESPRPWRNMRIAGSGEGEGGERTIGGSRGGDIVGMGNWRATGRT